MSRTLMLQHLRSSARANRLANRRLHAALAQLDAEAFNAPRSGFFPSLGATLAHLLGVDRYYLDALQAVPDMAARWEAFIADDTAVEWAARQAVSDARLIALCDGMTMADLECEIVIDRGTHRDTDPAWRVLAHLFMHQTHHRGQVHAMLSGTPVKPPQLDEFLLRSDAPLRTADLQALDWTEADLIADAPADDAEEEALDRVQTVRTLWECYESRSWAAARGLLAPDATLAWPVSGERMLDADAIIRVQRLHAEGWHIDVREVSPLADGRVHSIVVVDHPPKRFIANSFFRFDGTTIVGIDEYWSTVEAPPASRDASLIGSYERVPLK
jgi:uncharacterized damage-inducible protein DinB